MTRLLLRQLLLKSKSLMSQTRSYHFKETIFGYSNALPVSSPSLEFNDIERTLPDLTDAYHRFGYRACDLDPLKLSDNSQNKEALKKLLSNFKADKTLKYRDFNGSAKDLIQHLEWLYCGQISIEFMHLHRLEEQKWLSIEFEALKSKEFSAKVKKQIAELLIKALTFEKFLETKFPTLKRYSGEGMEAAMNFHEHIFQLAPLYDLKEVIWAGAHRGRTALHTILFGLNPETVFRKIRGLSEFPDDIQGSGDVISHLNCHYDFEGPNGKVHLSTVPNPSHLEVACSVGSGKARGRARTLNVGDYASGKVGDQILLLHFHGDGAFTGQGIVWENSMMSTIPHFRIGGSIHLIANNQIAFTAEKHIGRSSLNCTDIAKSMDCPVIHVNANSPEDVIRAAELSLRYRQEFRKDVYVNLVGFRRHGHNEVDNPRFTQPRMYKAVDPMPSIAETYAEGLKKDGVIDGEFVEKCRKEYIGVLDKALKNVDNGDSQPEADHLQGYWDGLKQAPAAITQYDTGIPIDLLKFIGAASVKTKDGFEIHPHLQKTHANARIQRLTEGNAIDWSTAEALAFGSLLLQGYDVRICGQDVGRATFSHRHAILVDQKTDEIHIPLNYISPNQKGFLEVANSPLSEEAVLGFEYGFSIEHSKRLCVWEAQFGDFYNTAQVQIDTLIATGESKWLIQSGLVLMLPHGFDGAGPDHSSSHIERFLQLTDSRENQSPVDGDNVNMHVVNPTTSAQYFHLLRRQVLTPFRKPLILISPKLILRHPMAASPLDEFKPGTHFQPILNDPKVQSEKVDKIVFVSGKHAYYLMTEREKRKVDNVAFIRLERLCPFPVAEIQEALSKYKNVKKFVWSQEEPRNAGAWSFITPRFENALAIKLEYAGRPELAHFATSIGSHHEAEAKKVVEDTFSI